MIEETLISQYGTLGVFIAYLIYDRHVILRKLMRSFDELSRRIDELE